MRNLRFDTKNTPFLYNEAHNTFVDSTSLGIGTDSALAHAVDFCRAAERKVGEALRESHRQCVEGMNHGDMGSSHRLAIIKSLPGYLASGTVVAEPQSAMRPKNITWLRIPAGEREILAHVNIVRFHQGRDDVYRLTRCDVPDLADFPPTPRLMDIPEDDPVNYMIGLRWTCRPDRSMSFLVRLLAGSLDFDRRLFFAYAQENIVKIDTRLEAVNYEVRVEPTGPEPDLSPRPRTDGS